ncbi:MAG TPA: signal peptide peptidase SppA [Thermoanaerobaculia bacterium]|jgi:protease-4|nr:signal peptide peptidase SppA [Thermoanaerobaculia bacterium]
MTRPWKFAIAFFAVGAFIIVAAFGVLFWAGWRESRVPGRTVLEVDLSAPFLEQRPEGPFGAVFDKRMRLRDLVEALHAAAADKKVVGLVARVSPEGTGLAGIEELRDAVAAFRASGKPAIAWTDTFGEVTPANGAYYLATAFDQIYIQPSGDVGLTGLELTSLFLRGTLDKLGVEPQFAQRYEYKNAPNTFTDTAFTPAHRESMDELAGSIFDHMVAEISTARKIAPEQLRAAIDQGPLLGDEAVKAKLVDGLLYRDEVYTRIERLTGKGGQPQLLYLRKYWERVQHPWSRGDKAIGIVYGVGDVMRGKSASDPLTGTVTMGSDTVAAALRAASEAPDVAAIVLRVDSPGGSYVASDSIWREVQRARKRGTPVIASFGDVAASGGYFVAMGADKIVAHPTTITGSIGVYGGKMVTRELWKKLGITFDSVQRGEHADMWSGIAPMDEDEWAKFNGWLDRVYADFTTKAAEGRHLPLARLQELAKGRVWSGVDAKKWGLVDELGGYDTALRLAKRAAHLAPDAQVEVREYPRPRNPFEEIFEQGRDSSDEEGAQTLERAIVALRPALRTLREAGLLDPQPPQVLRAAELSIR